MRPAAWNSNKLDPFQWNLLGADVFKQSKTLAEKRSYDSR